MNYYKSKEIKEMRFTEVNADLYCWGNYYTVTKEGDLIEKEKVMYALPQVNRFSEDLYWIDKQFYFQKWASRTNIPFWQYPKKDKVDLITVIQKNFNADGLLHDKIVGLEPHTVVDFPQWSDQLGKYFMDYQTDYVIYYLMRFDDYTFCIDIDFHDSKEMPYNISNIIEKEYNVFTLRLQDTNANIKEITKIFRLKTLPLKDISKQNSKAFLIGYRENTECQYFNYITD